MKKVLLTIVLALAANLTYSQRSIDWSIEEILEPTKITHAAPIIAHIICKNNGTDTAIIGDSLFSRIFINNNQLVSQWQLKLLTKNLAPGDTVHHVMSFPSVNITGLSFKSGFSAQSLLQKRPNLLLEQSGTLTNNTKAISIDYINEKGWGVNVNDLSNNQFFSVYPNPSSDFLNIDVKMLGSDIQLQIIDMTGKVVKNTSKLNKDSGFQVDVSDLNKGIYVIQIKSGDFINSSKIIIE